MEKPQPQAAFIAAALVLLFLPLLVLMGLSALGLAARLLMPADRMTNGSAGWLVLALFIVWVVLAVMAVLVLVSRLTRQRTRP